MLAKPREQKWLFKNCVADQPTVLGTTHASGFVVWSGTPVSDDPSLYLRQLTPVDNRLFIAAGNETEATDQGFTVPSSGIWEVGLSDDLADMLGPPDSPGT